MTQIGILSDTHSCWDSRYEQYFKDCDQIWHAGDMGDISIADRLMEIAPLHAVSGNIDHGEVKRRFPEIDIFEVEGLRVLITHIGGYPGKWAPGMKKLLKEENINIMVDGHSHILKIIFDKELNILHINPGAAGYQGWQKVRTLVRLTLDNGDIRNAEVIELGNKSEQADK